MSELYDKYKEKVERNLVIYGLEATLERFEKMDFLTEEERRKSKKRVEDTYSGIMRAASYAGAHGKESLGAADPNFY